MKETIERRVNSLDDAILRIGRLEKGQTVLENDKYQVQQALLHHKAETHGIIKETRGEVFGLVKEFREDIKASIQGISEQLGTFKKFQWTIMIGGAVVATMMGGLTLIAWQILTNHDKLSWIWR